MKATLALEIIGGDSMYDSINRMTLCLVNMPYGFNLAEILFLKLLGSIVHFCIQYEGNNSSIDKFPA
jgi:hypothetical protein